MKFNSLLIILFILLKQISARCYEPTDLLRDRNKIKEVDCGEWITEDDNNVDNSDKLVGDETTLQVVFTCLLENQDALCNKVQKSFSSASKTISSALKLEEKIIVNATLLDFCQGLSDLSCPIEIRGIIGSTAAKKYYSLLDDDGVERLYPQALVKQFKFTEHPKYDDYDILTNFNSRIPFYFSDDIIQISPIQFDFEFIITHELIHGLGFSSSWNSVPIDGPPIGLWPSLSVLNSNVDGNVNPASKDEPITVKESIFDKFMIRLDNGTFTSEYTKQIEKYFSENSNITINNFNSDEFIQTYQFQLMQEMLRLGETPKSLGFLPHNSNNYLTDAVILETSIRPFLRSSSISHVDLLTYENTSDFLMIANATPGRTLQDFLLIGGDYPGGVIGPKTRLMLETIGYATDDYQNPYKPQPFAKSQPKSTFTSTSPNTDKDNKSVNDTIKTAVIGVLSGVISLSIIGFLGYKWKNREIKKQDIIR